MSVYYTLNLNTTLMTVDTSQQSSMKYVVIPSNDPSPDLDTKGRIVYLKERTGVPNVSQFNVTWLSSYSSSTITMVVSSLQCLQLLEYPADVYSPMNLYGGTAVFSTSQTPAPTSVAVTVPGTKSALFVDLQTQSKTLLLPPILSNSPYFTIKDTYGNASTNPLFISTTGGATIDGLGASIGMNNNYGSIELVADPSLNRWHILSYYTA